MVLGYAYPAYECYKTVEKNKPEIEQLLFWCQYWYVLLISFSVTRLATTYSMDDSLVTFIFSSFGDRILVAFLTVCERVGDAFISW